VRHFFNLRATGFRVVLGSALIGSLISSWGPLGHAAEPLTIGSVAPALDIEHWVQDGNGKFKPVTKFTNGKVYVIEFWATWCGPCIQSMPHLAKLQSDFADKGVQIVSISDEDLETVEKFLERPVRAAKKPKEDDAESKTQTYRELTSAYCLTTDPDQSSNRDYMEAAEQQGIPTAFIVGKDSKIEWIGHPMEMDGPLSKVVEGTWDRAAYQAEMKAKQEVERMLQQIGELAQAGKFDEAVGKIDAVLKTVTEPQQAFQMRMIKMQLLLAGKKNTEAAKLSESIFAELAGKPEMVNGFAWNLFEMADKGGPRADEVLKQAVIACEKEVEKASKEVKASLWDTTAHILNMQGDKAKAIKLEEAAVEIAEGQDLEFMKQFLEELKKNS
jgi:thiol-disulfide isomerase/thioredoxin